MNLELMAMIWLRCEKRCEIVLRERSPRSWHCGQPDVLGITNARYMIEVEVKRSRSDFLADAKKTCRINRHLFQDFQPRQFFYFAEESVAQSIVVDLPPWAGLLYLPKDGVQQPCVIRKAPLNEKSRKLSDREFSKLTSMLTNHLLASETSGEYERDRFLQGSEPYIYPHASHYAI